jgi:peptidoglycan/LPS O-acetylase OafA/YrhL
VLVHVGWLAGFDGSIQHTAGVYAVDGFIILSGFVISQLLVTKNEPYGLYIFRRFMRLFPAFIACLAIALLVRPFTFGTAPSELLREASENRYFWWHLGVHASLARIGANRLVAAIAVCSLTAGMEYQPRISTLFGSASSPLVTWALRASRVRCPGDRQSHDARTAGCLET